MRISAVLSDYDGTLCPTAPVKDRYEGKIPSGLERVLWKISDKIPVCIVTSKDYAFIHHKTMFAKAASCVLGIETLMLDHTRFLERDHNYDCVKNRTLSLDVQILKKNSCLLSIIADFIDQKFKDLRIERKFTITGDLLVGITIDWRHLANWNLFREEAESCVTNLISEYNSKNHNSQNDYPLYLQTYSTHPFMDVYSARCTKRLAFDMVVEVLDITKNIMYLGDSENDNPAFQKADLSVGVVSDKRLSPKLDCDYKIDFKMLSGFLRNLYNNDFVFNHSMIP